MTNIQIANKSFSITLDSHVGTLLFDERATFQKKSGKGIQEMRSLMRDQNAESDAPLYEFFVGVAGKKDVENIAATGLRYDVIVIQPGTVSGEFKKTSGHAHVGPYPEIYEVLYGTAMFIMQKGEGDSISHFAAVVANAGERILVPPGYAHATVNIGAVPVVFSDLVFDLCKNEYGGIQQNHGLAYYVVDRDGKPAFEKNPHYRAHAPVKELKPVERADLHLLFDSPLYDLLVDTPEVFAYLSDPEKYAGSINYLADIIER